MKSFIGQTLTDVQASLSSMTTEAYRARQIYHWIYRRKVSSFKEMTDLPQRLRDALQQEYTLYTSQVAVQQQGRDGTVKLGITLQDGQMVEAVLISEGKRKTACLSTQVGCPIQCRFCASGQAGFIRNLTTGEMLEELLHLERRLNETTITNIVIMGIGEPFCNPYLWPFLHQTIDTLGYSGRRITVSTVGLIPGIEKLGALHRGINLAVSLHTVDDQKRKTLLPNAAFTSREIVQACRRFFEHTGRAVTFEVVLLAGVNDTVKEAQKMGHLVRGFPCKVNLIPYNPVTGSGYTPPASHRVQQFRNTLQKQGISAVIRKSKGGNIDAACGQLRLNRLPLTTRAP